jgi:hypothetical protein
VGNLPKAIEIGKKKLFSTAQHSTIQYNTILEWSGVEYGKAQCSAALS